MAGHFGHHRHNSRRVVADADTTTVPLTRVGWGPKAGQIRCLQRICPALLRSMFQENNKSPCARDR